MKNKVDRLIVVDGVDMCWCSREKEYQPCANFIKNKKSSTGYQYLCKDCLYISSTLEDMTEEDFGYQEVKVLLTRLGYDVDGEETVHQQFMKKYKL